MKSDFSKIKRKIIIQICIVVAISFTVGVVLLNLLVDGIWQDSFARAVVNFFQNTYHMDEQDAIMKYYEVFQGNKNLWLASGLIIILVITFYFSLKKFTKYFDEISKGVDVLVTNDRNHIDLSPELDFMEDKLNAVKSDLEKKTEEAKEAEQRKNDLVVYLAHDLKTPLTSVIGYLSLLEESPEMSIEQRAKYLGIALEKAQRLEELINEFFDITRFNLQSMELYKTNFDIEVMLRQMLDEFYPLLESKGLEIVFNSESNVMLNGDADKLSRVFNNIIKNAISYSYEDSKIIISIVSSEGNIEISIFNKGDKVDPQNLEAIFDKFYRADSARGSRSGGAGLGLAIAKEIVIAHGGTIRAASENDGTIFKVSLPK